MKKLPIQNIWQHPFTTIGGVCLAAALAMTHQPDWKHMLAAFGALVIGGLAKEA